MTIGPFPLVIVASDGPNLPLPAALEKVVAEIWEQEIARRPSLFNGRLFTVTKADAHGLCGRYVEYRQFLAQSIRPSLFSELQISPLAVTGCLRTGEGIIWGRRSLSSTQFPGAWELVPSGCVDESCRRPDGSVDLRQQLLEELREEVGVASDEVDRVEALCLLHDPETHLYNCVHEIQTPLAFKDVLLRYRLLPDPEHSELALATPDLLDDFVAAQPPQLAQLTRKILGSSRSSHAGRPGAM